MVIDSVPGLRGALSGKVIIITGAGRGIGREAARILARLGASVIIAELQATGQEVAELIRSEGGEATYIQTDVSDEASVQRLHAEAVARYGKVDILVSNATVFSFGTLWTHTVAEWDRLMAVNLRGAFLLIRTFLPPMLERKSGVVITMESSEGMPYLAPYLASKVGLRSLALSLAQEVGEQSGVSVFCFGPGMVDTPGLAEALAALPRMYGMNRDEFIRQSGVSLLPAEICATGLAGTILHAAEFHGQQAGYASGLARLGLNVAGEAAAAVETIGPGAETPTVQAQGPLRAALALNQKLEAMLEENIREYSELTLFQRPLVRRMFQTGTGFKVEEWLDYARAMTSQLERLVAGQGGWGEPQLKPYLEALQRLARFIQKQETDARGFFRNPDDLNRALVHLAARHEIVTNLAAALEPAASTSV